MEYACASVAEIDEIETSVKEYLASCRALHDRGASAGDERD